MKNEWTVRPDDILYEDDAVIVVNKPYGVPSQATLDPNRDHAYGAVLRFLKRRDGADVYAGLHHRLDALTTGVLLMTKCKAANNSISEQFQTHTIQKTYVAVCCGSSPDRHFIEQGAVHIVDAPIGELPGKPQKFGVNGRKRKPAQTEITCDAVIGMRGCTAAQFTCRPRTGRTHQIRVHLASLGLGIVEDPLYGEKCRDILPILPGRMCLHAQKLEFIHPLTGEAMTVSAGMPAAFSKFIEKCEKLRRAQSRTGEYG